MAIIYHCLSIVLARTNSDINLKFGNSKTFTFSCFLCTCMYLYSSVIGSVRNNTFCPLMCNVPCYCFLFRVIRTKSNDMICKIYIPTMDTNYTIEQISWDSKDCVFYYGAAIYFRFSQCFLKSLIWKPFFSPQVVIELNMSSWGLNCCLNNSMFLKTFINI